MPLVPLNVAADHLATADVLSYRMAPFTADPLAWLPSKMIAIGGRNPDVHTALLDRLGERWIALGMRLARQKLKPLVDEVRANPGRIDVYRMTRFGGQFERLPEPGLQFETRAAICDEMRSLALADRYGAWNVVRSSLWFLPFTRWLVADLREDDWNDVRPYCSQAVSHVYRRHAAALLNNRPDRLMLPGDVVTTPLLTKLFTLDVPTNFPRPIGDYLETNEISPTGWCGDEL
jgi:hypothetical protein